MPTIIPPGEGLRKAVQWISEQRREKGETRLATLVDEAAARFDLSPQEVDWLSRTLAEAPEKR